MITEPKEIMFLALAKLMNTVPARQGSDAAYDALTGAGYIITGKEADPSPAVLKLLAGITYDAVQGAVERISQKLQFPDEIADAVEEYDAYSDLAAWLEYQGETTAADDLRSFYLPIEEEVNGGRRALELVAAAIKPGPDVMQALTTSLAEMVGPARAGHILDDLAPALADAGLIIVRQPKEA